MGRVPQSQKSGTFVMGPKTKRECDEIRMYSELSTTTIDTPEWRFHIYGLPVYDHIRGPTHRIDINVMPKQADTAFKGGTPHGIIGQSFDGDALPRMGKLDQYPVRDVDTVFTTTAMGEGAIEGTADEYIVRNKYETVFKYSHFEMKPLKYSPRIDASISRGAATFL